jgi:hypothetical protein
MLRLEIHFDYNATPFESETGDLFALYGVYVKEFA